MFCLVFQPQCFLVEEDGHCILHFDNVISGAGINVIFHKNVDIMSGACVLRFSIHISSTDNKNLFHAPLLCYGQA